jgi:uncharacterized protein (DUF849 family)
MVGVSTGAWIEGDAQRTRACIAEWRELPDHASVNLSEADAPAVMSLLDRMGVGIEVGLATVADAERFAALPRRCSVLRVLIEIEEQDDRAGDDIVDGICLVLARADVRRPILLHGLDDTTWHFVGRARARRWSTRIGLEDGPKRPDGTIAADNAELIGHAVRLYRDDNLV